MLLMCSLLHDIPILFKFTSENIFDSLLSQMNQNYLPESFIESTITSDLL